MALSTIGKPRLALPDEQRVLPKDYFSGSETIVSETTEPRLHCLIQRIRSPALTRIKEECECETVPAGCVRTAGNQATYRVLLYRFLRGVAPSALRLLTCFASSRPGVKLSGAVTTDV
jgi:hypothetical protein